MRRAVGRLRSAALARGLRCWALQRNASAARAAAEGRLRVAVGRMRLRTLAACFRACAQLLVLRRQREARSSAAMWARALGRDRQAAPNRNPGPVPIPNPTSGPNHNPHSDPNPNLNSSSHHPTLSPSSRHPTSTPASPP